VASGGGTRNTKAYIPTKREREREYISSIGDRALFVALRRMCNGTRRSHNHILLDRHQYCILERDLEFFLIKLYVTLRTFVNNTNDILHVILSEVCRAKSM